MIPTQIDTQAELQAARYQRLIKEAKRHKLPTTIFQKLAEIPTAVKHLPKETLKQIYHLRRKEQERLLARQQRFIKRELRNGR